MKITQVKNKSGGGNFGAEGNHVSVAWLNTETMWKYIREQENLDKFKTKEYVEPFKGNK